MYIRFGSLELHVVLMKFSQGVPEGNQWTALSKPSMRIEYVFLCAPRETASEAIIIPVCRK